MSRVSITRLLHAAWAQFTLALVAGILLTFVPSSKWYSPLHEIGIGLIVAAFVTLFWHLREFSEFFETFAKNILLHDEYLAKLSVKSLTSLRSKAARKILESCADNPQYERGALGDWIDDLMFNHLLPGKTPLSGMYRENYEERVEIDFITLREALAIVASDPADVPSETLTQLVLRVTETAWYTVIPPSRSDASYLFRYTGRTSDMKHFPLEHRIALMVGEDEATATTLSLKIIDDPLGGVSYSAPPKTLPIRDGRCTVWLKTVEYRWPASEPHVLNTMNIPTRNIKVNLTHVGGGPKLGFSGDLLAAGPNRQIRHFPRGISIDFAGWLFEDHGYFLWWWEE